MRLDLLRARHPDGGRLLAASHGNLISLILQAFEPGVGFDFHLAKPAETELLLRLVADAAVRPQTSMSGDLVTGNHELDGHHVSTLLSASRTSPEDTDRPPPPTSRFGSSRLAAARRAPSRLGWQASWWRR